MARCQSMSLLVNELYVQSVLHRQVTLAAVNHICVIHEAINGCKNLKIHKGLLRKCEYKSKNINPKT